jgi:hypothetical protein
VQLEPELLVPIVKGGDCVVLRFVSPKIFGVVELKVDA